MKNLKQAIVIFKDGPVRGGIEVVYGRLASIRLAEGKGKIKGASFSVDSKGESRLLLAFAETTVAEGGRSTRVTVRTGKNPFTFFLRDVNPGHPIFIPSAGVIVTTADDSRTYKDIAAEIQSMGLRNEIQRIETEPEEDYDSAAARTRSLMCPTWLGLSRDMRIFELGYHREAGYWGSIRPRFHGDVVNIPEYKDAGGLFYNFTIGRGAGCTVELRRWLEEGVLPIVRSEQKDDDVVYDLTAFVASEKTPLTSGPVRGTHYLVAEGHGAGHTFTKEQQAEFERLQPGELEQEEPVLHVRTTAVNTAPVPRYAWFRVPSLHHWSAASGKECRIENGFGVLGSERVYCTCRLNGKPMNEHEVSVLVQPGEQVVIEFAVLHQPVSRERAEKLARADFDKRLTECKTFWKKKLAAGAQVEIPERRINEMVKAGLLHLDLVTYGNEPKGSLAATIGVYAPIGSESAPIINFFDSMGWHDVARRSIQFFLDTQRDDGSIMTFGGYRLETGCVLYLIGEHYRYTKDIAWLRSVMPKAMKAVKHLLDWRKNNMREDLRGRGYGMLDGKVADPEDPLRQFMNSGYACMGLKRTAEWLAKINPREAKKLAKEAEAFRRDIRTALADCIARSPVVPLGDGTWCPTVPPWAEGTGALSIFCDGEPCFTHHAFSCRDSLIGPLWLVFQEIVDPKEPMGEVLLASHAALHTIHNVAFSQPYYSRHDYVHLLRGEHKAFLKTYYNGLSGLADRETYTWWEHYFHASPHKTHEEGWFLMQTRWMLLMEEERTLHLLRGIPRAWLASGKRVAFRKMCSYFGPVSLQAEARGGEIEVRYELTEARRPEKLVIRVPHPQGLPAREVKGGGYCPQSESVIITKPKKSGTISLRF